MATKAPEAPTRDQLLEAIRLVNADAKAVRDPRSPTAKALHEDLNRLLDEIVGA